MTISDQITRLNNAKAAIKQSIENKGVEVSDTALLDEYPALIDSIEAGSSGGDVDASYYDLYLGLSQNGTSYNGLFKKSCSTELDLSNWDTSQVTTMYDMFYRCEKLTSLDVSNWETSNVTTMYSMFSNCQSLESLDLSSFDTSNVTNMGNMFQYCGKLSTLDLSNFDTRNVTNMSSMFYYCSSLTTLYLSNWDMSKTTDTSSMFNYCTKLHTLRLDNCSNDTINKIITSSSFPTNAITGVIRKIYCKESEAAGLTAPENWVFEYVEEPIPLYESGQFSNNTEITEVRTMVNDTHTDLANMFNSCINLTTINTADWDTSNVTNMNYMFNYCHKLITLDLSNFDTSNVTSMYAMFNYCSNLEEVDLRNFDMTNTTNVNIMFGSCYELRTLRLDNCSNTTIGKIITSTNFPAYAIEEVTRKIYCKQENITGLTAPNGWVFVDYMTGEEIVPEMPEEPDVPDVPLYVSGQFSNKSDITEVNTMVNSTHTSLANMFDCCYNLASIIGIEDWDTSNVTTMNCMFNYCAKLITLDLSNFDTSKVTDMSFMFNSCSNLEEVDLRNFDMTNTTNVYGMFSTCYELHTLRLDNCSNATINKIVTSNHIQTGTVNGTKRKIYCKEENASGLTVPNGWEFIFVE